MLHNNNCVRYLLEGAKMYNTDKLIIITTINSVMLRENQQDAMALAKSHQDVFTARRLKK